MLFPESDSPLVKAWIVKRLENNSDADADVLADYVLALLRHDGDVETIRKLFEAEIPDFLREDAAAFTDDVLQVVKYRAYLPGAPPPPPIKRHTQAPPAILPPDITSQPAIPPPTSLYKPAAPYPAPPPPAHHPQATVQAQGGSRKRPYGDHDEVDIILTSRTPHAQPYKQARRGGGFGQRGGRHDDYNGPRSYRGPGHTQAFYAVPPGPGSYGGAPLPFPPPPMNASSIMENIQLLQSLLPPVMDLPKPVYSGTTVPPHRRKQRCRDYDAKGYCPRGNNCNFEHGTAPSYDPSPRSAVVDEYDPSNAALALPPLGMPMPQEMPQLDIRNFQTSSPANRPDAKKPRRTKDRAVFTANGPNHDKAKTTIVVQNIPEENLTDDQVRGYFSQFGKIPEVTIQRHSRLAIIKFDTWDAAHTAWSSPKVIFDNRFVKVFWYKEEGAEGAVPNGKGTKPKNGHVDEAVQSDKSTAGEPDFDLDEFYRKTVEAQKIYDEKMRKRQEIEQERQQLEARQKELRERQEEAKRELEAKLKASGVQGSLSSTSDTLKENKDKKSNSQTEALKAQLAALEREASQLGIDPDDNYDDSSSWTPRGRGRGRGHRGRGAFAPRAIRGGYGYRGRGGTVEARHAAYAAYSLDNRPKVVALSGIDFTLPDNDEALRQYLFSVGEFKDVHMTPTAANVSFKDRKTAEKFMAGVTASDSVPGVDGKIEATWVKSAPETTKTSDGDTVMGSTLDEEQSSKEKVATGPDSANAELEEGEIDSGPDLDQRDMDYESGEW